MLSERLYFILTIILYLAGKKDESVQNDKSNKRPPPDGPGQGCKKRSKASATVSRAPESNLDGLDNVNVTEDDVDFYNPMANKSK